jgi:hypothetical protein
MQSETPLFKFQPIQPSHIIVGHPWLSQAPPASYSPVPCRLMPYGHLVLPVAASPDPASPLEPTKTRAPRTPIEVIGHGCKSELSNGSSQQSDGGSTDRRTSGRYAYVKSKICPEETQEFLKRKEAREYQRLKELAEREVRELQECTFRPNIGKTRKPRY